MNGPTAPQVKQNENRPFPPGDSSGIGTVALKWAGNTPVKLLPHRPYLLKANCKINQTGLATRIIFQSRFQAHSIQCALECFEILVHHIYQVLLSIIISIQLQVPARSSTFSALYIKLKILCTQSQCTQPQFQWQNSPHKPQYKLMHIIWDVCACAIRCKQLRCLLVIDAFETSNGETLLWPTPFLLNQALKKSSDPYLT